MWWWQDDQDLLTFSIDSDHCISCHLLTRCLGSVLKITTVIPRFFQFLMYIDGPDFVSIRIRPDAVQIDIATYV